MNRSQLLTYISPRLAILKANLSSHAELIEAQVALKSRHKSYFHIFNLTTVDLAKLSPGIGCTNFKWRGIPFCLTQALRILAAAETYQSVNGANAAIIAVPDNDCYEFALFMMEVYAWMLGARLRICCRQGVVGQFMRLYKTVSIKSPPVKILESLHLEGPKEYFIPLCRVYTEARHNNFEEIYSHEPLKQLGQYYLGKNSPLEQGIGSRYCHKQPETKYFSKPVLVCGDVKIEVLSYDCLQLKSQFICGFNTKCLEYQQTLVEFNYCDLYQLQNQDRFDQGIRVVLQVHDYCQQCKEESSCSDCLEIVKKMAARYSEAQVDLEKLNKTRRKDGYDKIFR